MSAPSLSLLDRLLAELDHGLRVVVAQSTAAAERSPAAALPEAELDAAERRHAAGLMRVNHSGEVCAQALYRAQALFSADGSEIHAEMIAAGEEEEAHLAWCQQRLDELDAAPSLLNPLWYGASFALGAAAGLVGERLGLGFVAATEDQVCLHLRDHLERLPAADQRSRALVARMLEDETAHAHRAKGAGALLFPGVVQAGMTLVSRVMTGLSYRV